MQKTQQMNKNFQSEEQNAHLSMGWVSSAATYKEQMNGWWNSFARKLTLNKIKQNIYSYVFKSVA